MTNLKQLGFKVPEKKESPKGKDCNCMAYSYSECGCYADWADNDNYNNCIDQINSLETDLSKVFDIEKVRDICDDVSSSFEWGCDWRTMIAQAIITNLHKCLKEEHGN